MITKIGEYKTQFVPIKKPIEIAIGKMIPDIPLTSAKLKPFLSRISLSTFPKDEIAGIQKMIAHQL